MNFNVPFLKTNKPEVDTAFRIAVGDLLGNVQPYAGGQFEGPQLSIMAGLDYDRPWTRDAAINCWNGASLLVPEIARNTLCSVLTEIQPNQWRVGGQYWDAIIWITGAWWHYLYTGDREFLELAFHVAKNTLDYFEATEFDPENSLFRGPACYGDGIAAYPDAWANLQGQSCILDWPRFNPDKISDDGYGIPMLTLSTNCLYYNAYVLVNEMARRLEMPQSSSWKNRATKIKSALNQKMWQNDQGRYSYFLSPLGDCAHQEGLGHAFAILFTVVNETQRKQIFNNLYVTPAGIPCVWPTFERYALDETSFGRHSGTVWPHIQGFWGHAAAIHGKIDIFAHEFFKLTEFANRDSQFAEIYHPRNGEIYGGLQESPQGIVLYKSCRRQTWSATAYLRLVFFGLLGMRFEEDGIRFSPCVPNEIDSVELNNFKYRDKNLTIRLRRRDKKNQKCYINGKQQQQAFIVTDDFSECEITIEI